MTMFSKKTMSKLDSFINDFSKTVLSVVHDNRKKFEKIISTHYFFLLFLDGLTEPTNSTNNTFAVTKKDMKAVLNGIIQLSTLLGTPIKEVSMRDLYSFVRAFVNHRSKLKNNHL